ncbi:endonuclease MutS2 [Campylobacter sp. RM12642]|uniref:endonuclease MutS2 n=1 Tax=unclassified Campylobacter TaxID=2593542 RepID=UPI001D5166C0|nr:endonuclease MutS2 [Campylobacter sp. RM12651]MBZ7979599.1 endonuclease MutS2 [Campylobacter sp. RM12642]MBZ7983748.1 endonuclease MutS2 [Campylobacter sp. RM12647]MBZ7992902.1 endonuclease MutS2 [Campylobacter sp. RM9333]MBZ8007375.1 endonuclease MutS2 [Campylobacter sp. RM9334]ULO04055.1 DNA mismatch binding protein, MutS2 family [Campylobacter sp. RM12651]
MLQIIKNLDLVEYLDELFALFARNKPLFIEGDTNLHLARINELCEYELKELKSVKDLSKALNHLSKKGILHLDEIEEFVKILNYFKYLFQIPFSNSFKKYLEKIIIPNEIENILKYFKDDVFDEEKDELLQSIKIKIKELNQSINQNLRSLLNSKSLESYLIDTQIHFISNTECLLVRGGFAKVLDASIVARSSGGGFYVEPSSILNYKQGIKRLENEADAKRFEYAKQFSEILSKHLLFLKFINKEFDLIDSYIARVNFAKKKDLNFITPSNDDKIILSEFCHPALNNPKPVSVEFKEQVLLITGVNAGGKSMLLKSILAASFMTKYLVPMRINANKSHISTFKEYISIIEDPQMAKNDISTFAGRMLAFAKMNGKKNFLLGVDEIELGTDFEEASSLFFTLICELKKHGKLIITTHHKRLAMLLAKEDKVELLAALYDIKNERPKYEFLAGIVGKSYAYETALRYGISASLVELARKSSSEAEQNINEMLNKNLELDAKLKMLIANNEKKENKLNNLLESLKDKENKLIEEYKKRKNELENEYFKAINAAKKTLDFSDLKDKQRQINAANVLKQQIKPESVKREEFKIGDFVKYEKIKGKIIALNKNIATVQTDMLQLKLDISMLKRSGETPKSNSSKVTYEKSVSNASTKLDLHGLRSEEAIELLDKFISDALIIGFDEIIVYHGIGTGRLAYAVKEYLKTNRSIKSFCDAPANAGGFGAKIIRL